MKYEIMREIKRKDYNTKNKQKRTGYVIKDKIVYNVACKIVLRV